MALFFKIYIAYMHKKCYSNIEVRKMVKRIKSYKELKIACLANDISIIDFAKKIGYSSIWGMRCALEKGKKSEKLWEEINIFFRKNNA
ncbi:hypothetical protein FUSNEC_GEN_280_09495 [Fusobacterium necrophorum subsp. funduliforme]